MEKQLSFHVFQIVDSHGNHCAFVIDDLGDQCTVWNIFDKEGNLLHFESEAYHLATWANDNSLTLAHEERSITLDVPQYKA